MYYPLKQLKSLGVYFIVRHLCITTHTTNYGVEGVKPIILWTPTHLFLSNHFNRSHELQPSL